MHQTEKVEFQNNEGETLSGRLEMPLTQPLAYAVFAHCFTCSKDIAAASRIARGMTRYGVAVLRFDFTGLGNSDGDFANTNFSSNVQDLKAAADFLTQQGQAPSILVGHSLGGAAVLAVADQVPSVKAVVTIGAPSDATHVSHLFGSSKDEIEEKGLAKVSLVGREFTIKKQFLDDIEGVQLEAKIKNLRRALLIFHSPQDETVSIDHAKKIYIEAKHPKSFVSLDGADHLLSRKEDSEYVADVLSSWVKRYLDVAKSPIRTDLEGGKVLVQSRRKKYTNDIYTETHHWVADEPKSVGGYDLGPNPYDHLLGGLGACTNMTLRMYAERKGLALDSVKTLLTHTRVHAKDCEDCKSTEGFVDVIERQIQIEGDLTDEQYHRLVEIADRCPVHRTLTNEIKIKTDAKKV